MSAAAEDTGVEESNVDESRPTAGSSSSHDDEYMAVDHQHRTSDHVYRQLNANQSPKMRMQSSPTYDNLPPPSFSADDHDIYVNHQEAAAVDDPDNRLYVNVHGR